MPDDRQADISIQHIPVRGGVGVFLIILLLVTCMLIELPQLRWPVIGSAAGGVLLGLSLIVSRRRAGLRSRGRFAGRPPRLFRL
jgi:hypothetical protein